MLTVVTPTYNRETELKRVYNSLINQTNKDFEWIVVDDGSKDNTKKLIEQYKREGKIQITYIFKENGGKPSAYNIGVKNAKGEILVCLDSDDLLIPEAVEIILKDYEKIKDQTQIAGLVYNVSSLEEPHNLIGTNLPDNTIDTYYNIYEKYMVKGDKTQVIKVAIAIKYLFPILNNEKFIPEALINNRISKKFTFLYNDVSIKLVQYLSDGYSANYFELVKKNPLGNALYFKELYDYKKSFYNVYGYILFNIYGKMNFRKIIKGHRAKFKIMLLYIPTLIISKLK